MSELPRCYTVKYPKARKQHRCCECGGIIEKGEVYELYSGIWDEPQTFKTCSECKSEKQRVFDSIDPYVEEYPCLGALYEDLSDWDFKDFIRVVNNRKKRGVQIWPWMKKRIEEEE